MKGKWERYAIYLLGASQEACLSSFYGRKSIWSREREGRGVPCREHDNQVSVAGAQTGGLGVAQKGLCEGLRYKGF